MLAPTKSKVSGSRSPKRLQPMDSNSSETVAVISLGGSALQPLQSAVHVGQIVKTPAASKEVRHCHQMARLCSLLFDSLC
jgi:hypothetical protein